MSPDKNSLEYLPKGKTFEELPESYVIFITQKDFFKLGLPLYHITQRLEEKPDNSYDDGTHVIYVNGEIEDNSTALGRLIHDIKTPDPEDISFSVIKQSLAKAKAEEGRKKMTYEENLRNIVESEIWNRGLAEGEARGLAKGEVMGKQEALKDIVSKMKESQFSKAQIAELTGLSEEEIEKL